MDDSCVLCNDILEGQVVPVTVATRKREFKPSCEGPVCALIVANDGNNISHRAAV